MRTRIWQEYRILEGHLIGSYIKGSMSMHAKFTNVSIPLGSMPKDDVSDILLKVPFYQGIEALRHLIQQSDKADGHIAKNISADYFPLDKAHCRRKLQMNFKDFKCSIQQQALRKSFCKPQFYTEKRAFHFRV